MRTNDRPVDGYVSIREAELPQLEIRHLTTALDMSIAVPENLLEEPSAEVMTGYTEWVGDWRGAEVSIGWDWGYLRGGIRLLAPIEIRSNILLVAADGTPHSSAYSRLQLAGWLDCVPWRTVVLQDCIHPAGRSS